MKILDRYILQTFLVSLLIVGVVLMGFVLMLDLFFHMDEFLEPPDDGPEAGFWRTLVNIGNYYFYKAFDYLKMLAGPWLLLSALPTLARFNRSGELTSVKAAGVSMYRVLWPIIVLALVADGLYIVNQEFVVPEIAAQLSRDPDELEARESFSVDFIRDEHNSIIYAPRYDPEARQMRAMTRMLEDGRIRFLARVRIFLRDANYQPRGTIEAAAATWDPTVRAWRLEDGRRLRPGPEVALLDHVPQDLQGEPVQYYATDVDPRTIDRYRAHDFYRFLGYEELKDLARDPMRGNRRALQVALHRHVTDPILLVLTLLLGLPFVAGREEGSYFVSVLIGLAVVLGVMVLTFTCTAFGNSGHLDPLLAAWIPAFVILPASIVAMETFRT